MERFLLWGWMSGECSWVKHFVYFLVFLVFLFWTELYIVNLASRVSGNWLVIAVQLFTQYLIAPLGEITLDHNIRVRFFGMIWIPINHSRSLWSWCIKETNESTLSRILQFLWCTMKFGKFRNKNRKLRELAFEHIHTGGTDVEYDYCIMNHYAVADCITSLAV